MFATDETVGLAEWIIYDTCLVFYISVRVPHFQVASGITISMTDESSFAWTTLSLENALFTHLALLMTSHSKRQ